MVQSCAFVGGDSRNNGLNRSANQKAVLFLTIFSFVTPSAFFLSIAAGIAFAIVCAMFLNEPKGAMAEIMPDGTVQLTEVH